MAKHNKGNVEAKLGFECSGQGIRSGRKLDPSAIYNNRGVAYTRLKKYELADLMINSASQCKRLFEPWLLFSKQKKIRKPWRISTIALALVVNCW